jgi:hypothetical protein
LGFYCWSLFLYWCHKFYEDALKEELGSVISFVTGIRKWLRGKDEKRIFYNANAIWNLNVNELSESAKGAGP